MPHNHSTPFSAGSKVLSADFMSPWSARTQKSNRSHTTSADPETITRQFLQQTLGSANSIDSPGFVEPHPAHTIIAYLAIEGAGSRAGSERVRIACLAMQRLLIGATSTPQTNDLPEIVSALTAAIAIISAPSNSCRYEKDKNLQITIFRELLLPLLKMAEREPKIYGAVEKVLEILNNASIMPYSILSVRCIRQLLSLPATTDEAYTSLMGSLLPASVHQMTTDDLYKLTTFVRGTLTQQGETCLRGLSLLKQLADAGLEAASAAKDGLLISPGQDNLISVLLCSHVWMDAILKSLARDSNSSVSEAAKLAGQPRTALILLKTEQLMAQFQRSRQQEDEVRDVGGADAESSDQDSQSANPSPTQGASTGTEVSDVETGNTQAVAEQGDSEREAASPRADAAVVSVVFQVLDTGAAAVDIKARDPSSNAGNADQQPSNGDSTAPCTRQSVPSLGASLNSKPKSPLPSPRRPAVQAEPAEAVNIDQSHAPAQEDAEQPALPRQIESKADEVIESSNEEGEEAVDEEGPKFTPDEVDWPFLLEDATILGSDSDEEEVTGNELEPLSRGGETSETQNEAAEAEGNVHEESAIDTGEVKEAPPLNQTQGPPTPSQEEMAGPIIAEHTATETSSPTEPVPASGLDNEGAAPNLPVSVNAATLCDVDEAHSPPDSEQRDAGHICDNTKAGCESTAGATVEVVQPEVAPWLKVKLDARPAIARPDARGAAPSTRQSRAAIARHARMAAQQGQQERIPREEASLQGLPNVQDPAESGKKTSLRILKSFLKGICLSPQK